jgi:hypothetical protein
MLGFAYSNRIYKEVVIYQPIGSVCAPCDGIVSKHTHSFPVLDLYSVLRCAISPGARSLETSVTVHPPNPPPVKRLLELSRG